MSHQSTASDATLSKLVLLAAAATGAAAGALTTYVLTRAHFGNSVGHEKCKHSQESTALSTTRKQAQNSSIVAKTVQTVQSRHENAENGCQAGIIPPEFFHYRPIGYLRSCFTTRNGTPRQPLLVEEARARLTLLPDVPDASLEGLSEWSHVWVLYVFHENTESHTKRPVGDLHGVKGKVKVPRLNGQKVGLFATRTPHRPVPVGLSVAKVISVGSRHVVLGGADIVDGSPVLDIKPYVPFCDSVPTALAPAYVKAEADDEPLAVSKVIVTELGTQQLVRCWGKNRSKTLYSTSHEYIAFVTQVLSRDIRSLRQRLDRGEAARKRNAASLASAQQVAATLQPSSTSIDETQQPDSRIHPESCDPKMNGNNLVSQTPGSDNGVPSGMISNGPVDVSDQGTGVFHVVLEGIDVSYDVSEDGTVIVGGASLNTDLAKQHAHKHRD